MYDFVRDPDLSAEEGYWCHYEGTYFTDDPSTERFLTDGHYGYWCEGPHVNAIVWIGDDSNTVAPFERVDKLWTTIHRAGSGLRYPEVEHLLTVDHYYGAEKATPWGRTLCGLVGRGSGKGIRKCQSCLRIEALNS